MTTDGVLRIASQANTLFKDLRRLTQDAGAYRRQGRIWLEGDHLCRAFTGRGHRPAMAVFADSAWERARIDWALPDVKTVVMADALFSALSTLESPAHMAFVIEPPAEPVLDALAASVVLDRVQDAGNVGAILRSAGAFGFRQVIAIKGTAALWSPKVLRAGMGAHFGLRLIEGVDAQALDALAVPLIATSSHQGDYLHERALPWPCAWAFGHEGQGVGDSVASRASVAVRIIQPGGEESLNVASAAAICLHASACARAPLGSGI